MWEARSEKREAWREDKRQDDWNIKSEKPSFPRYKLKKSCA